MEVHAIVSHPCCIYQGQWDLAGRQESQYVDRATTKQLCQDNPYSSLAVVY